MYVNIEFGMATVQCRDYIFVDIGVLAVSLYKSEYYQEYRCTAVYIIDNLLLIYSYNCKTICMQILEWIISSLRPMEW